MTWAGVSDPPGHDPPPASSMESAPLQMANMQAGPATSDSSVADVKVMCESVGVA